MQGLTSSMQGFWPTVMTELLCGAFGSAPVVSALAASVA